MDRRTHTLTLSDPWFDLVRCKLKNVDGRLYDEKRRRMEIDDVVLISNTEGTVIFQRRIVDLSMYESFRQMIQVFKLGTILPHILLIEDGVKLYHSIPGYQEKEQKLGVVVITLA